MSDYLQGLFIALSMSGTYVSVMGLGLWVLFGKRRS